MDPRVAAAPPDHADRSVPVRPSSGLAPGALPEPPDDAPDDSESVAGPVVPSLHDLPIAGLTRRRVAFGLAVLVSAWIVIVFARQVGDAQAATARAEQLGLENTALVRQVEDLEDELDLIQRESFVRLEARAYRLGGTDEVAFRLGPDAPELAADAPGSAASRLGAASRPSSPLESWLALLFGPDPGS